MVETLSKPAAEKKSSKPAAEKKPSKPAAVQTPAQAEAKEAAEIVGVGAGAGGATVLESYTEGNPGSLGGTSSSG